MTAADANPNKTWELSLYELHRTPQKIITDNTEIAVSVRSLHSELMCPICLDMLKETMTTKECLHRFCHDCIITALRAGNKECPTCRKKLISKRSLREDRNFDAFISRIYPSREDYEAQQERVMAKVSKHHFAQNIEESQRMQAMNRVRNNKRTSAQGAAIEQDSVSESQNPATPLSLAGISDELSEPEGPYDGYEFDNATTTTTDGESVADNGEVEVVLKPLPQVIRKDASHPHTRYIKITVWGVVGHIGKYLEMRCDIYEGTYPQMDSNEYENGGNAMPEQDNVATPTGNNNNNSISTENGSSISNGNNNDDNQRAISNEFTMYIAGGPGQFNPLPDDLPLVEVFEKYWRVNKPLELYYGYKMEPTVEKTSTGKNGANTPKTW